MNPKQGSRAIAPGTRVHSIVADLCIVLDAIFIAGEAALGAERTKPFGGFGFTLASSRFPLRLVMPIAAPFYLAMQNNQEAITYQIRTEEHVEEPIGHITPQFRNVHITVFSAFYVMFYERYRPWFQQTFGREVKDWPELFRFCWAVRNAAAHHESRINFTNPNSAPVTWGSLTYSPSDNGRPIFSPNDLSVGDVLFLIFEMSDELDALGAPLL